MTALALAISDRQRHVRIPRRELTALVERAAQLAGIAGELSLALVDDAAMQEIHAAHSGIAEPTDVLAFPLAPGVSEIVVSAQTAAREARARRAPPQAELLLYVVHGLLHLAGHDDHAPAARTRMRAAERRILRALGHTRPR